MSTLDARKNFAIAAVNTGYDDVETSIVLETGKGARFPDVSTEGQYNLVYWNMTDYNDPSDDPYREIVRVVGISGDTLTITRAQEGTVASDKNLAGKVYAVANGVTEKMIDDIEEELDAKLGASFETYSKNLSAYPYVISEVSSTVTTITYDKPGSDIIKTITEVSSTVTTIVLSGIPAGIPTTKTITEGLTTSITYS